MHEHQPTIWDWAASEAAKQAGIDQAGENKKSLLEFARKIAVAIAIEKGEVYSDLVMAEMIRRGVAERALGNAGGAVFTRKQFEWTGRFHKSTRVIGHGNLQRIWRLRRTNAGV